MTKARIESDSLNEMWQKWLRHRFPSQIEQLRWSDHIDRVNLKYGRGKDFDEFVWECGGIIRQQNSKRYLEFFNDEDAIMFALRWA